MADSIDGFPPPSYSIAFVPLVLHAAASANRNHKSLPNLSKIKQKSKEDKKNIKQWRIGESKKKDKLVYVIDKDNDIPATKNISSDLNELNLMQLLALNALELSVPASDIVLKNRKNNWIQLSGHEGAFCPAGPGTIWKKRSDDDTEVKAYEKLTNDVMAQVVPKFYRDLQYNGEYFMEIQDLLAEFENPAVMDIKMGVRTFVESEVSNEKLREDLYQKMIGLEPSAATKEEQHQKAITKLRYMQFRESLSSTSTLGFRIEGYKTKNAAATKDIKLVKTREQVSNTISIFLCHNEHVRVEFLKKLLNLRSVLETSPFFASHEIIGSSLLFMYDHYKANVCMIDFAKTFVVDQHVSITHSKPWTAGNHEDGYLTGLNNLIAIIEDIRFEIPAEA